MFASSSLVSAEFVFEKRKMEGNCAGNSGRSWAEDDFPELLLPRFLREMLGDDLYEHKVCECLRLRMLIFSAFLGDFRAILGFLCKLGFWAMIELKMYACLKHNHTNTSNDGGLICVLQFFCVVMV